MATCEEWIPPRVQRPEAINIDLAAETKCSYLEILQYPGFSNAIKIQGELSDGSLSSWLSKDLTQPGTPVIVGPSGLNTYRVEPSSGLRLLYGVCGFNPEKNLDQIRGKSHTVVPFTKESFGILEDQLGLPSNFLSILGLLSGPRAFKCSGQGNNINLTCYTFKFTMNRPSFYQLALSYNRQTRLTYGLLLAKSQTEDFSALIQSLEDKHIYCNQPLFLAVLIAEVVIDQCALRVNISDNVLNNLEEKMGQHRFVNRPKGNPLELDFLSTTSEINFQSRKLGLGTARLQGVLLTLRMILDEAKYIAQQGSILPREPEAALSLSRISDGLFIVEEMVQNLINSCQNTLARIEYETNRTQTLTAVVYQFMAQKDARINIQLAENSAFIARASKNDSEVMRTIAVESKKDSSAMKAIAVLTMFFLPGTFLAAIFDLPFFNWDSDGYPIIKGEFKYYWAVTIPLTVIVFVLWALATLFPWKVWLSKK